jgi:outer membrane receptor for ferrienterochelin and colicin
MAVVYKHIRNDSNEVFYIGIGKSKYRMNSKTYRNKHWYNIVNKYGYRSELIEENISWDIACKKEIELIKKYGRRDSGMGSLVNMTDGGEGSVNPNKSAREKMSAAHKGKITSEETKQKISESLTGNKKSKETLKKMSICKTGENHPRFGKAHKQIQCPYCNKSGGVNVMKRWHFGNCKSINKTQI